MTQLRPHTDQRLTPWRATGKSLDILKNKDTKSRFYKAAAALANADLPNSFEDFGLSEKENAWLNQKSKFLEPAYQELAHSFYAPFSPLLRDHVDRVHYASGLSKLERVFGLDAQAFFDQQAIFHKENKSQNSLSQLFHQPQKDAYRNGEVFFWEEIASLLFAFSGFAQADTQLKNRLWHHEEAMSAAEFHHEFMKNLTAASPKSFVFSVKADQEVKNFSIDRANLHWAYRLRKKSGQKSAGTEPNVKYFHAELLDSANAENKLDLVYWLKFDGHTDVVAGEFLAHAVKAKPQLIPLKLWMAHENILNNLVNKPFDSNLELIFSKVLGLYIDTL